MYQLTLPSLIIHHIRMASMIPLSNSNSLLQFHSSGMSLLFPVASSDPNPLPLRVGDEERQVGLCVGGRAEGVGLVDRGRVVHGGGTEEGVVG